MATNAWVGRGRPDRQLLVGMRFAALDLDDVLANKHVPFRVGSGPTFVAEPGEHFRHIAGPIYLLDPSDPDALVYAECATCGDTSKGYKRSARRFARSWAYLHRCPREVPA